MPFFKRLFFAPPQKFTRHAMIALSGLSSLLYTFSSVICQVSVKIFIFRAETNNAVREIEIYINSCATHAQKICKRLSDHDYVLPSCKSHFSKHKLSPKTKGPRGEFNGILPIVLDMSIQKMNFLLKYKLNMELYSRITTCLCNTNSYPNNNKQTGYRSAFYF